MRALLSKSGEVAQPMTIHDSIIESIPYRFLEECYLLPIGVGDICMVNVWQGVGK
ncbi:hypothetical protein HAX54_046236, partial [Datura stramonium]|nr:hypothetical protein [Datura stramonium]